MRESLVLRLLYRTGKRKAECYDMTYGHLISPCDGYLSFVRITEDTVLDVKNTRFTLDDLLKDHELAGQFSKGCALRLQRIRQREIKQNLMELCMRLW